MTVPLPSSTRFVFPDGSPTPLPFYGAGNKLFVTDEVTGDLLIIDLTTREEPPREHPLGVGRE